MDCPQGFYCNSTSERPIECPPGTYGETPGLVLETDCTDCPTGLYCWTAGQTEATTACPKGYYCEIQENTPNRVACPAGYYCEVDENLNPNTNIKTSCPIGTYSNVTGLYQESDCKLCIPGFYCDELNLLAPYKQCEAGYYCPKGSTQSTDIQQICPKGNYCPPGTADPKPCQIGSYQDEEQQSDCKLCQDGNQCDTNGLTSQNVCEEGKYCKDQKIIPCPAGTYNPNRGLADVSQCKGCDPFKYCEGGQDSVTGNCDAGYDCSDGNFAIANPAGKLCPPGSYCETGEPILCPEGTYRDSEGATNVNDCYPCTAGYVCGLGTVNVTQECPQGNFCPPGTSVNDGGTECGTGFVCPTGSPDQMPCDVGTFTDSPGQFICQDCPAGKYCEPDDSGTPVEKDCEEGYYCPARSYTPTPCPDGTFGNVKNLESADQCQSCGEYFYCIKGEESTVSSLTDRSCRPGFLCLRKMSTPTPLSDVTYTIFDAETLGYNLDDITIDDINTLTSSGNSIDYTSVADVCSSNATEPCGGVCPPGHYCPQDSTQDPRQLKVTKCPSYRSFTSAVMKLDPTNSKRYLIDNTNPGARQEDECSICPPGFLCIPGLTIPTPCPKGYYCPNGNFKTCYEPDDPDTTCDETDGSCPQVTPVPCPINTYNNQTGQSNIDACLPCLEDYICDQEGTALPVIICPDGYYCPGGGVSQQLCPAGEYSNRATTNGKCEKCDQGYYCVEPTDGNLNTNGQMNPCDAGFECPSGASRGDIPCEGGYYCPAASNKTECEAGYYCPEGSANYINNPCNYPDWCGPGQAAPYKCPAGSIPIEGSFARTNKTTSCSLCPAGEYKANLDDLECHECPEGYFCPEGTGDYTKNPCPLGYSCPGGTATYDPCPQGTYGTMNEDNQYAICVNCLAETYQNQLGQLSCLSCGVAATTYGELGQKTCTCTGVNRIFQNSDASCICAPETQYTPLNQNEDEENSKIGCENIVYERCANGQTRQSTTLQCVSNDYVCTETCDTSSFDNALGACVCDYPNESVLSNCAGKNCIDNQITLDPDTRQLTLNSTDSNGNRIGPIVLQNAYFGPSTEAFTLFSNSTPQIVSFGESKVEGVYTTSADDAGQITTRSGFVLIVEPEVSVNNRNKRQTTNTTTAATTTTTQQPIGAVENVANPIMCIEQYDPVIFLVTETNFPVYARSDVRNTNPYFDYGDFRDLGFNIRNSNLQVDSFTFVFTPSPGRETLDEVYVFYDNTNVDREVVITVKVDGGCSDQAPIQPQTQDNYRNLNVDVGMPENLTFPIEIVIGIVCAFIFIILAGFIIYLCVGENGMWNKKPWEQLKNWLPGYKPLDEQHYNLPAWLEKENKKTQKQKDKLAMKYSKNQIDDSGDKENLEKSADDEDPDQNDPMRPYKDKDSFTKAADMLIVDMNKELTTRTFVDKLEDQNIYVASMLANHHNTLRKFYHRINKQTKDLDKVFEKGTYSDSDAFSSSSSSSSHSDSSDSDLSDDDQDKTFIFDASNELASEKKELKMLGDLENALKLLSGGNINLSSTARQEALNKLHKKQKIGDGDEEQSSASLIKQAMDQHNQLQLDLAAEEIRTLAENANHLDDKHLEILEKFNESLKDKLKEGKTDEEVEAILNRHNEELERLKYKLQSDREKDMKKLREKLAKRRDQKQRRLARQQRGAFNEANIDLDLLPPNEKLPSQVIANLENKIESLAEMEVTDNEKDSGIVNKKAALIKSLQESGQLNAEALDLINEQFEKQNNANKRTRNNQLNKLRNRMKNRRKNREEDLSKAHASTLDKTIASGPSKEHLDNIIEYHDNEKNALITELDNLDKQENSDLFGSMKLAEEQKDDNLVSDILTQLTANLSPEEANELLAKYKDELNNMKDLENIHRNKNKLALQQRINNRRNKNLAKIQKEIKQNEEEQGQDRLDNIENKLLSKTAETLLKEEGIVDSNESKKLDEKFEKELSNLKKEIDQEDSAARKELNDKLSDEKLKQLQELHQKQQAEIAQEKRNGKVSNELLNKIMQDHMLQEQAVLDKFERKKAAQRALLNERLAKRAANKKQILSLNQQSEKAANTVNDVQKKLEEKSELLKNEELKELEQADQPKNKLSDLTSDQVRRIMEKRHREEIANLEKVYKLRAQQAIIDAKLNANKKFNALREKIESDDRENLTPKERLEKLSEIQDNKNSEILTNTEYAETETQLEFTKQLMVLKDKHYQETIEAIKKYANEDETGENGLDDPEAIQKIQEQLEKDAFERQQKAEEEMAQFQKDEEERKKRELEEFEKELEQEAAFEASKANLKFEQLNKEESEFQMNQRANLRKKIEEAREHGASENEQKRIMEQFERDREAVSKKFENNKNRIQNNLQARLNKRRKQQMSDKKKELNDTSNQRVRILQKQKNEDLVARANEEVREKMEEPNNPNSMPASERVTEKTNLSAGVARLSEKPTVVNKIDENTDPTEKPSENQEVFNAYNDLTKLLSNIKSQQNDLAKGNAENPQKSNPTNSNAELDFQIGVQYDQDELSYTDQNTAPDNKIHPISLQNLDNKSLLAYEFLNFINTLLTVRINNFPRNVLLLPAKLLPARSSKSEISGMKLDLEQKVVWVSLDRLNNNDIAGLTIVLIKVIVRNFYQAGQEDEGSSSKDPLYNNCLEILTEDIFNKEASKIKNNLNVTTTPTFKQKLQLHIEQDTETASTKILPRAVPTVDEMLARVKKVKNSVNKIPQKQYISEVSEVILLLQESINNVKAENLNSEGKAVRKAVKKKEDLISDLQKIS